MAAGQGLQRPCLGVVDSYRVEGTLSFVVAKTLKLLKEDLRRWNKEEFGKALRYLAGQ